MPRSAYLMRLYADPERKEVYLRKAREAARRRRKSSGIELRARKFGITQEKLLRLMQEHDDKCAICKLPCPTGRSLAIDHSHKSGEVRGLLCGNCNRGIGMFRDDPELMRRAADYVGRA